MLQLNDALIQIEEKFINKSTILKKYYQNTNETPYKLNHNQETFNNLLDVLDNGNIQKLKNIEKITQDLQIEISLITVPNKNMQILYEEYNSLVASRLSYDEFKKEIGDEDVLLYHEYCKKTINQKYNFNGFINFLSEKYNIHLKNINKFKLTLMSCFLKNNINNVGCVTELKPVVFNWPQPVPLYLTCDNNVMDNIESYYKICEKLIKTPTVQANIYTNNNLSYLFDAESFVFEYNKNKKYNYLMEYDLLIMLKLYLKLEDEIIKEYSLKSEKILKVIGDENNYDFKIKCNFEMAIPNCNNIDDYCVVDEVSNFIYVKRN